MALMETEVMTASLETYREGVTAFRNAARLAEGWRNLFIEAANVKGKVDDKEMEDWSVTGEIGGREERQRAGLKRGRAEGSSGSTKGKRRWL